jgi:pyruvate/2-oxoglutarate dehydrogenase complex dihydrolipoamide dehydrogenase (E3) component
MYRRFGSRVTVIEKFPKLLPREDEDVVAEIRAILEREGVAIHVGVEGMAVSRREEAIVVKIGGDAGSREITGSHLLLAVGRMPNTEDLGLKAGGINADARGFISVDDQCRTSADGVWALGDCNGRGAFTHTSWNDYEIVAANLFDRDARKISDRIPCYALFIDPPLGRVGMNEAEAKKSGRKLLHAKIPMTRVGRAREAGETQGFMKVIADADSRELLGAAILGLNGDEIVHSLLDVMYAKQPYTTISRAVHIHPTVTELVPTLLQSLKPLG